MFRIFLKKYFLCPSLNTLEPRDSNLQRPAREIRKYHQGGTGHAGACRIDMSRSRVCGAHRVVAGSNLRHVRFTQRQHRLNRRIFRCIHSLGEFGLSGVVRGANAHFRFHTRSIRADPPVTLSPSPVLATANHRVFCFRRQAPSSPPGSLKKGLVCRPANLITRGAPYNRGSSKKRNLFSQVFTAYSPGPMMRANSA